MAVAYKQVPLWMHSNEQIGKNLVSFEALDLSGERIELPSDDTKNIYVFWATWCGPCHIQLAQFDRAVKSGDLNSDVVVAVSLDKSQEDFKKFLIEKKYTFKVVRSSSDQSWIDLNIRATPTIAFVENKKVINFFTGISPLSVYKAKSFLE